MNAFVRRCTGGTLIAASVATTGCLHYEALPLRDVTPGTLVRLQLTGPGATGLITQLGAGVRTVDGRLVTVTDRGYLVAVSSVMRDETRVTWADEQVLVPTDAIVAVQHRVLDKGRTAVVVGAVLAGAIITGKLAKGAGGGAGTDPGGHPTP